MELDLARKWWVMALRGVLAILFGVMAFFWPGVLWLVIVLTFAAYALVDGVFAIAAAVTGGGRTGSRWALALEGLLGIAAGILTVIWPGLTELALLFIIAGWSLATGIFEIVSAFSLKNLGGMRWLLGLGGVLSIALGLGLALMPLAGLLVLAWWIGANAIAFGITLIVLAFQLRGLAREAPSEVSRGRSIPVT